MATGFTTNVLGENGVWSTRTLDASQALQYYDQLDSQEPPAKIIEAPVLGLLTQTVIPSPMVNFILPVKARGVNFNDVAFVGDRFVQIKELRSDGRLWDIATKQDFGHRIRNARILGVPPKEDMVSRSPSFGTQIKPEDEQNHFSMNGNEFQQLPPQMIVLQTENDFTVFLVLRRSAAGEWNFFSYKHRLSRSMEDSQAGMTLTIDPSSRYMAVGGTDGPMVIYHLQSWDEMNERHRQGLPIRPVITAKYFKLDGYVHKMEFLYPAPDDLAHIILLILLVNRGKTRMLLYEWELDTELTNIQSHHKRGHQLAAPLNLPLLLIPLTIRSSFILISETSLAVCKDIMIGQPKFEDFFAVVDSPTAFHHGLGNPLWTAWTRPVRLPQHAVKNDDIFIVREDGFLRCLEIHTEDDLIKADVEVGVLTGNCGEALACLNYDFGGGKTGDYVIANGDSGAGASWLLKARKPPIFCQAIANWSRAVDFVTTSENQDTEISRPKPSAGSPQLDKAFACVGRGANSAIIEYRYGLEASISLEMDLEALITEAWVLSPPTSFENNTGPLFLLSVGGRSVLLQLSLEEESVIASHDDDTPFVLHHRTVAAAMHNNTIIQVTENTISLITESTVLSEQGDKLNGIYEEELLLDRGSPILNAVTYDSSVLFSFQYDGQIHLRLLTPVLVDGSMDLVVRDFAKLSQVTSFTTCLINHSRCAIMAETDKDAVIKLTFQLIGDSSQHIVILSSKFDPTGTHAIGDLVSIVALPPKGVGHLFLICGTSTGMIVMIEIDKNSYECRQLSCKKIGDTAVHIKRDEHSIDARDLFFANCDSKLVVFMIEMITIELPDCAKLFSKTTLNRIYLTEASSHVFDQPEINAIAKFAPRTLNEANHNVLLAAGSKLLVAGLDIKPKAIPRVMPIAGSPNRLHYAQNLDLLIVAAYKDKKSTLLFIDPKTGEDVSLPQRGETKDAPVDYIIGLGKKDEKIYQISEWIFHKGKRSWNWIIVATSLGKMLLISTQREKYPPAILTDSETLPKLRYWTRSRFHCSSPIYCFTTTPEGIIYCTGDNKISYQQLNVEDKRFEVVGEYTLPSPGVCVVYSQGKITVSTINHSLLQLELERSDSEGRVRFRHTHSDNVTRNPIHHRPLRISFAQDLQPEELNDTVYLVSDRSCTVQGLWGITGTWTDCLEVTFMAELSASILRFRHGRTRPSWDQSWLAGKHIGNSLDSSKFPETLGMAIDGSLTAFTVISRETWCFLRFMVNLASQSSKMWEFPHDERDSFVLEPSIEPKQNMHVDGDILRRILDKHLLGHLLRVGLDRNDVTELADTKRIRRLFKKYLTGLNDQDLNSAGFPTKLVKADKFETEDVKDDREMAELLYLAYNALENFLRPVL